MLVSDLLRMAGIKKQASYTPLEVQKILNISYSSFIRYTNLYEPSNIIGRDKRGLESYRVGAHRRVPHHAIIEWLEINHSYREYLL